MTTPPPDHARRGVLAGIVAALLVAALVVVVVAVVTGSYLILTGLVAVGAGGWGAWYALSQEDDGRSGPSSGADRTP